MLRVCGYIDEVLCARGCERRLSHLSGSRDSVHFLSIDAEWSLDDAMLVHAFRFLQETVHAQRKAFGKAQRQVSTSPVTQTTVQVLRHRFTTRFPPIPHHVILTSHVGCVSGTSSACLIEHVAQDTGTHPRRRSGARYSPVTSCGHLVVVTAHLYMNTILISMHVCFPTKYPICIGIAAGK